MHLGSKSLKDMCEKFDPEVFMNDAVINHGDITVLSEPWEIELGELLFELSDGRYDPPELVLSELVSYSFGWIDTYSFGRIRRECKIAPALVIGLFCSCAVLSGSRAPADAGLAVSSINIKFAQLRTVPSH